MDICWLIAKECGRVAWIRLTYSLSLRENVEILKRKMEELKCQKNDIKTELHRGEKQVGKKRKREVNLWLRNVKRIIDKVDSIEAELQEMRWYSRSNIGTLVAKVIEEIAELQEKHKYFNGLLLDLLPNTQMMLPVAKLVGETTAKTTLEKIWDCLMDAEISKIGVYGMGGVGKTSIMKHIHNRLREDLSIEVFWVTASKGLTLNKLQIEIAKAIELGISTDEDDEGLSKKIFACLMKRKKFILLFDDMWKPFPLDRIGIPEPYGENGCKLVFITRDLTVCRKMESQRDIKVDMLSADEAWELFSEKAGIENIHSRDIKDRAKDVSDACGHLPLTIVNIARALRHQSDLRVWKATLDGLRISAITIECMQDDVFKQLKSSYKRLRKQIQDYFLYCALYPKNYAIPTKELIEYWMWEGLIPEEGNRDVEINKGQKILSELKNASMLEGGRDEYNVEYVKMHDLVRDLAVEITRTSPHFMIKAGLGLERMPQDGEWAEDIERISLMRNSIEMLSGQPSCSKLSTLLLQNNILENISESFFDRMGSLKVLDLSHTNIESLPSVSNLEGLHALLLGSCKRLKHLPSLAKLKALRALDLSLTPINELPQGLEVLVELRRLDLSWTHKLEMLPAGVISKFQLLEDLELYGNGWRLSSTSAGAHVEEVASLKNLVNMSLHFADLPSFASCIRSWRWQQLKCFSLVVGQAPGIDPRPSDCSVEIGYSDLIPRTTSLMLPDKTRTLRLRECQCLKTICKGILPHDTLTSLRSLDIEACHDLRSLFSVDMLKNLLNLEAIKIQHCRSMEEMVAGEEGTIAANNNDNSITLPFLTSVTLIDLPGLKSVCEKVFFCGSLTTILIRNCPRLEKFPFSAGNLTEVPNGEIGGSQEWWHALEWDDPNTKTLFQPLFKE